MMSVEPIQRTPNDPTLTKFRYVEPDEFCRLVVSFRPLQRCDDPQSGLRGLEDQATGEHFFVEALRLTSFLAMRHPR